MQKKLSSSMEDYLETILILEKSHSQVRVKEIARYLNVKMPSVTAALNKLKDKKLIENEKYGYVYLTPEGRKIAEKIYNNHMTLKTIFVTLLNIPQKIAEKDACKIEHVLSPITENRISRFIQFINDEENNQEEWLSRLNKAMQETSLDLLQEGDSAKILKITASSPELKQRLQEIGLRKKQTVKVVTYAPLKDPMKIQVNNYFVSLRISEAQQIIVKKIEEE